VERQTDMAKLISGILQLLIANAPKTVMEFYHSTYIVISKQLTNIQKPVLIVTRNNILII
jgi:hypothetical protein